jgi:hypothetical protein
MRFCPNRIVPQYLAIRPDRGAIASEHLSTRDEHFIDLQSKVGSSIVNVQI